MERYSDLQSRGDAGSQLAAQSRNLRSLLESGVATGANEQWKMNVKRILGVDLGQVAGQEAVTALSNEMILPQVKQLGVNPTDRDLSFVVAGSPSLTKTKEGNLLMLDALDLKSARNQLIAKEAADFVEKAKAERMTAIDARLGLDRRLRELMQTHPLWTEAPKQLQERMSKVIAQPSTATDGGPPSGVEQWEWDAMSPEDKALWQ